MTTGENGFRGPGTGVDEQPPVAYRSRGSARDTRKRMLGVNVAIGTFLSFGMLPLAAAPTAQADIEDVFDQLFSPFVDAATSGVDWDAFTDATAWST
ncbi:hypothetical protein, partial [Mycobacterium sp. UM_Kg1]|uniref:hypothetical protein n=1 Tax=Mycobacterium sp. UM_Kg1 TaxID=1545691 RepID=UPI00061A8C3F